MNPCFVLISLPTHAEYKIEVKKSAKYCHTSDWRVENQMYTMTYWCSFSLCLSISLSHTHTQLSKSNEHTVTLRSVPRIISGKYQCEVSADAPLFHTETSTAKMLVAELPAHNPVLSVYNMPNNSKNGIAVGELLKATCVSGPSFPPVNFTWTINGNIHPVSIDTLYANTLMIHTSVHIQTNLSYCSHSH